MTGLEAAVAALAVYRLTLLVVADGITAPIRDRAVRWANERRHGLAPSDRNGGPHRDTWEAVAASDPHWLAALLDCPWCASMWIAPVVTAASYWWAGSAAWWLVCGTLAGSAVAGYLASKASP